MFSAAPYIWGAEPNAQEILDESLNPPSTSYKGHMTVTHWTEHGTRSEEFGIIFIPPNSYRLEFYHPDGRVSRVVWSDGTEERLGFPQGKKVYSGKAIKSADKRMDPDDEWTLLLNNYSVDQKGMEAVAGRPSWILTLVPKENGKPEQILWVDKKNYMILKVKRYLPKTNWAVLSEFRDIDLNPKLDPSLFKESPFKSGEAVPHGLDPNFKSLEETKNQQNKKQPPTTLIKGFVFESGDNFKVKGNTVHHFRYTDGLIALSLFETAKPVPLGSSHMVHWQTGPNHFTLMGDLTTDALQQISMGLK